MVLKRFKFYYNETMPRLKKDEKHHPKAALVSLAELGRHLSFARKRRRIGVRDMAKRMMISPTTLIKLEKGDPGVSIGALASALWVLGLQSRLTKLIAPETDTKGLSEESRALPQRVRQKKSPDSMDF